MWRARHGRPANGVERSLQRAVASLAWERLLRLRRRRQVQNGMTFGLVFLGPLLAVSTFLALGPLAQSSNSPALRLILLADFCYILIVAAAVLMRVARLIADRRSQSAGSRLHLRLSGVFAADEVMKGSLASYTFEHMEIASYTMLIAAAEELGEMQAISVLTPILEEERAMAAWLGENLGPLTRSFLARAESDLQAKR